MQRCCRRLAAAAAHVTCRGKKLASAIWPIKLSIGLLCANCVAVPHSGFAGRLVLRTNSSDVKAAGGPPAGAAAAAARVADDCQQRQQQPQAHTDQCPPAAKAQPCPRPQPCAQCPRLPDPPPRAQQPRRKRMPWQPLLSHREVRRGLSYYGSGERLQALVAKLQAGQPIKAFTLGGRYGGRARDLLLSHGCAAAFLQQSRLKPVPCLQLSRQCSLLPACPA